MEEILESGNRSSFKKYLSEKLRTIFDENRTIITSTPFLSKKLVHLFRMEKINSGEKVWISPEVYSLNFFVEKKFQEIPSDYRIMNVENAILLFYKVFQENHFNYFSMEYISEFLKLFNFIDRMAIQLKNNEEDEIFNERVSILDKFNSLRKESKLLAYSEIIDNVVSLVHQSRLKLPKKIVVFDSFEFSPIEQKFIEFLKGKCEVESVSFENGDTQDLELFLYEKPEEEVQSVINQVLKEWKDGKRSIAISYFEDDYKKLVDESLREFEPREGDKILYNLDDDLFLAKTSVYQSVFRLLNLSSGILPYNIIFLLENPFFKKKIDIETVKEKIVRSNEPIEMVKSYFNCSLSFFLNRAKIKVGEIVGNVKQFLKNYQFDGVNIEALSIVDDYLKFFEVEIGDEEIYIKDFSYLFEKILSFSKIKGNIFENIGIDVIPYKLLPFTNYEKVFLLGCHQGVLPSSIENYSLLSGKEKEGLEFFKIEKNIERERKFFESVVKSNEIQFSRSKANENLEPYLSSPFINGKETEKIFSRFDKNLNQNFHSLESNKIVEGYKSERVVRKNTFNVNFSFPQRMSVTGELTSINKCPFQFFIKYILKVEEVDEYTLLFNRKDLGSFLHQIIEKWTQKTKDYETIGDNEKSELKRIMDDVINGYDSSQFEKECLNKVLSGREGKKGILDNFIDFERKRIEEGFIVVEIEAKKAVNLEGIEVTGKMDRVEENGEILRIIDFKSGKSATEWDKYQVKIYIKMEKGIESDKKVEGGLCHILDRFKFNNITIAGEDFQRVEANIEELRNKIVKVDPFKDACKYCSYSNMCHFKEFEREEDGEQST